MYVSLFWVQWQVSRHSPSCTYSLFAAKKMIHLDLCIFLRKATTWEWFCWIQTLGLLAQDIRVLIFFKGISWLKGISLKSWVKSDKANREVTTPIRKSSSPLLVVCYFVRSYLRLTSNAFNFISLDLLTLHFQSSTKKPQQQYLERLNILIPSLPCNHLSGTARWRLITTPDDR